MTRATQAGRGDDDAYKFLSSILAGIAQPVWVIDHGGEIRFANPAALAALGYDDAAELRGQPSHETIHYKHPDGSHYPAADCPMLRPCQTGETIHSDEDWFVRRDGTMIPVEYWSAPIDTPAGRGAVVAFTDIQERRRLERATRERDIAQAHAAEARAAQRRIIEAADTSRAQLARELHDGAQQQFLNTILNLQRAEQDWSSAPERARHLIGLAVEEVRRGIDGLRELAAGIHPAILATRGLAAALDALAARLPFPLELEIAPVELAGPIEASVYFFCSEALANAAKHAQAQSAHVKIAVSDGRLAVQVSDDGSGGADTTAGGLAGLRDRIAALDGTLEVNSPPSGGTTLTARIPLGL